MIAAAVEGHDFSVILYQRCTTLCILSQYLWWESRWINHYPWHVELSQPLKASFLDLLSVFLFFWQEASRPRQNLRNRRRKMKNFRNSCTTLRPRPSWTWAYGVSGISDSKKKNMVSEDQHDAVVMLKKGKPMVEWGRGSLNFLKEPLIWKALQYWTKPSAIEISRLASC